MIEMINIVIEIPKGDNRRRHLKYDKSGFIDLGPIKEKIPVNDGIMPVHYGYIPGTQNMAEKDEVDALLISEKTFRVGEEITIRAIALLRREDVDDKIVAVEPDAQGLTWDDVDAVTRKIVVDFFGYTSKIISIESSETAVQYISENRVK